jgi:hypothetical protein
MRQDITCIFKFGSVPVILAENIWLNTDLPHQGAALAGSRNLAMRMQPSCASCDPLKADNLRERIPHQFLR